MKKLFVASLPWVFNDDNLKQLFSQAGTVVSAQVILDRETGRSRGFGFVEMSTPEEAEEAIQNLNGTDVSGRRLVVNLARPRSGEAR